MTNSRFDFNSTPKHYSLVLVFAMLICGYISVRLGKELCFDLARYHYYNPFAFWEHRQAIDFWPSTFVHQYINPAMDFLSYYLINHFTPRQVEFILGAIHGINFWLLFQIARPFLQNQFAVILALTLALFGIYGPTALPGIGSFQNDNLISIFILAFVFLQLKTLRFYAAHQILPKKILFFSGLMLGMGFGLKLTAGLFVFGGFIAALLLPVPVTIRVKWISIWAPAVVCGFLVTAYFWMDLMWQQHHNPFFPFFNGIFHSPDFISANWRDTRFLPQGFWQTLFYPFYFSFDGRTSDSGFRDIRFLLAYVLFFCAGLQWLWQRKFAQRKYDPIKVWLFTFFIISYFVWQYYFSIARYIAPLEMLTPLVLFLLLRQMLSDKTMLFGATVIICYLLVVFMLPIPPIRLSSYEGTFFNIQLPEHVYHTESATVLMAYSAYVNDLNPRPQMYLIPSFPKQWRFIGIPFWHEKYSLDKNTKEKIQQLLHGKRGKIYLLTADLSMPELFRAAREFGLARKGHCEKIYSDRQMITDQEVLLCLLEV